MNIVNNFTDFILKKTLSSDSEIVWSQKNIFPRMRYFFFNATMSSMTSMLTMLHVVVTRSILLILHSNNRVGYPGYTNKSRRKTKTTSKQKKIRHETTKPRVLRLQKVLGRDSRRSMLCGVSKCEPEFTKYICIIIAIKFLVFKLRVVWVGVSWFLPAPPKYSCNKGKLWYREF